MAKKFVVANWKENPQSPSEARNIFSSLKKIASRSKVAVIVCPPSLFIPFLKSSLKCALGLQDVSKEIGGSFTGEISAQMAKNTGVMYSIVGHSERRVSGDTDAIVNQKMRNALSAGLSPIVCVGESVRDKDGFYLSSIESQVRSAFAGIDKKSFKKIIIAYEPVWAVGKSEATALKGKDVHEATLFLRKILATMIGKKDALLVPILYGGSVFPENVLSIMHESECQGLLVGRQSLDPRAFAEIVKVVEKEK